MGARHAAAFGLFAGAAVVVQAVPPAQGVGPADEKAYKKQLKEKFKCLDGSQRIALASFNDDFCDCADGSDEPGTAACAGIGQGRATDVYFYCKNEGSRPRYIYRSRVQDGICDCCDGSDEQVPGREGMAPACQDACDAEERPYREAEERKQANWQKAVDMMNQLAESAEKKVPEWQKEYPRIASEIPNLKKAKDLLKKKYEDAEKNLQAKIEKGVKDSVKEESQKSQVNDETKTEEDTQASLNTAEAPAVVSEYAKWMEGGDAVTTTSTTTEIDYFIDFKEVGDGFDNTRRKVHKKNKEWQIAEAKYWEAKYKVKGLEVTSGAAISGTRRALADLDGKCISKEQKDAKHGDMWKYTVCFYRYGKREEVGKEEENKNNLGRWMRWEFSPMPVAVFERGDVCSTPEIMNMKRTLKIVFSCGFDAEITSVEEGPCKTDMKATHPGACGNTSPPAPDERPTGPIGPHDEL